MSCKHCVTSITEALEKIDNMQNISIDPATGPVHYKISGNVVISDIKKAISQTGYTPAD